jgi:hypothetical protein
VHRPAPDQARDTAVLVCPPFGWDEVCSYRSLRTWGESLAAAGYATLRINYPSTGDSGGSVRDPDRVGAWTSAIAEAAEFTRSELGARRVVGLGIGLGGVLAYQAVAEGAPIDDLVLWATPARARALVRQFRAFSKLERSLFFDGLETPPELPDGELEAGGFLLTAETVNRLEALDLALVDLPRPGERRVLLLERDGLPIDAALREHLERAGVQVTLAPGPGFADMTSHPQQAESSPEVIETVQGWLDGSVAAARALTDSIATQSAEIRSGADHLVRETPIAIPETFGNLAGVLTEPLEGSDHGLCVVLLNAGAVRRTGPNRMWVEAARRWAQQGVPSLRLDIEGIGDADGAETPYREDGAMYEPEITPQVVSALDYLQARGAGDRFVLAGLCASANWAFHVAVQDPRVSGVMLINLRAFFWDRELVPARDLRALFSEPFSLSRIRRVATGPRIRSLLRWVAGSPARLLHRLVTREPPGAAVEREIDTVLDAFVASGKRALFLFTEHEPVYDELVHSGRAERLAAAPNVTFERIRVRDHTMRPSWAQSQGHAALDRALAREPGLVLRSDAPVSRS